MTADYNTGSLIEWYDFGQNGDPESLVIHEFAHYWQTSGANPYWNDFKAVSGWTTNPPNDNYVLSPGGEWYFHSDLGPLAAHSERQRGRPGTGRRAALPPRCPSGQKRCVFPGSLATCCFRRLRRSIGWEGPPRC